MCNSAGYFALMQPLLHISHELQGALQNNVVVAVKKLHDMIEILEDNFQREVACLVEVKHKNIVRFLGYCSETQNVRGLHEGNYVWANVRQRLFCFEYLKKGSLAKYITGKIISHITKHFDIAYF